MQGFLAVLEKEIKSYFMSPIAYVVIALFLGMSGIFFYINVADFAQISAIPPQQAARYGYPTALNVNLMVIRPFLGTLVFLSLVWLPLITMRLFAEEKKSGTLELLFTSPITNAQTLLGKFSAGALVYVAMLLPTFLYVLFLNLYGNPELKPMLVGYLGLFLIGLTYIAFGVLFSSTTENQIVAAVETYAAMLFLWAIGWIGQFLTPAIRTAFQQLSIIDRFDDFAKGILDSKNIVFYLSFIAMGLFLTYIQVESTRWRGSQ